MGEPASRVTETNLAIPGLDDIFNADVEPIEQGAGMPPAGYQHGAGMSLKAACRHYKLAPSTLRSKIKAGEIPAEKVQGSNGPEWRVFPMWLRFEPPDQHPAEQGDQQGASTVSASSPSELNRLLDLVEKQAAKLEAAAGQIGYLQAQLETKQSELATKDQAIKLLEDRQRVTWWRRTWSWFVRGGNVSGGKRP